MKIDYARIVRLRLNGLSLNSIAKAVGCKWETVSRVLERCTETWGSLENVPLLTGSNASIEEAIYSRRSSSDPSYCQPDCDVIINRQRTEGSSRYEEYSIYCEEASRTGLKAYSLSRFNGIVTGYYRKHDISIRLQKEPGIEGQVDWVGDKAIIYDRDTGEEVKLHIFVMALPYSGYFFAEAFPDEKMASWLKGHADAFSFFGGCPAMMVPDNCRTAVNISRRWYFESVVLNPQYKRFMDHYNVVVSPARVYHPKDKSVVERSVQIVEKDLMREMNRLEITSVDDYNSILLRKLRKRLALPYTKRIGSRTSIFIEEEAKKLLPLPVATFKSTTEREATVGRDFHLQYGKAFYSVPCQFIGDKVRIKDDGHTINIYSGKGELIATHRKAFREWQRSTLKEHEPKDYSRYGGYSPQYFLAWAKEFGESTYLWVDRQFNRVEVPATMFKTVLCVLQEAKKYDRKIVNSAAAKALDANIHSVKGFKALLLGEQKHFLGNRKEEETASFALNDIYFSHSMDDGKEEPR